MAQEERGAGALALSFFDSCLRSDLWQYCFLGG